MAKTKTADATVEPGSREDLARTVDAAAAEYETALEAARVAADGCVFTRQRLNAALAELEQWDREHPEGT